MIEYKNLQSHINLRIINHYIIPDALTIRQFTWTKHEYFILQHSLTEMGATVKYVNLYFIAKL